MIAFLALALAAAPVAQQSPGCADVITPEALICRAIQAQSNNDPATAAQSFEQAAVASPEKDPALARIYAAAGNMWIAANQPGKAAFDLDKALALPGLEAEQRGEALLDRARAAEAQDDLKTARAKLNQAADSVSDDPFYWYFSAALAIREGDAITAQSAIGKALTLAPADATILFEAGHVAQFTGDEAKARDYWARAAAADPTGPVGKAAAKAQELLGLKPVVQSAPPPPAKH